MSRLSRISRDILQLVRSQLRGEPDIPYDALREREERYRLLAEQARDIIWLLDFPDQLRYVSPACKSILGWSPQEQVDRPGGLRMLTKASAEHARRLLYEAIANRLPSVSYEAEHNRVDGTTIWCEVRQGIVYDEAGQPLSTIGVTRDISDKRRLQEQLTSAQKSELIGTLAGGVAHDFNNFLTVILGSLELVAHGWPQADPRARLIADAIEAAERSAALTAQLLAFSRHQPVEMKALDINAIVLRAESLIRRAIGERIELTSTLEPRLAKAWADEGQLQQILINLVMNARDAIESDGRITIETTHVTIDPARGKPRADLLPGAYVLIEVSDDGAGMSAEVLEQSTRPFFSTKPKGRGTGLGLAMVDSILSRIGGALQLESELGRGTTIRVYLAAAGPHEAAALAPPAPIETPLALRGEGEVMVVDDERAVREIASRILQRAGYTTRTAASPDEAIRMIEARPLDEPAPDLVLTDLVMPRMSGSELAARIRARHPEMGFVVMSGYIESEGPGHEAEKLPGPLVSKPFHTHDLLRAVQSVLAKSGRRKDG